MTTTVGALHVSHGVVVIEGNLSDGSDAAERIMSEHGAPVCGEFLAWVAAARDP